MDAIPGGSRLQRYAYACVFSWGVAPGQRPGNHACTNQTALKTWLIQSISPTHAMCGINGMPGESRLQRYLYAYVFSWALPQATYEVAPLALLVGVGHSPLTSLAGWCDWRQILPAGFQKPLLGRSSLAPPTNLMVQAANPS